jgi:putative hemolysin
MYARENHTNDFLVKGVTPGKEGGEFYLRAQYHKCVASESILEPQEICTSTDFNPMNQQALSSFFNIGMPNSDGVYCHMTSYQLEDVATHETTDNALDHLVLKGANVGIDSTGKLLQTTRDVQQLEPTSVSFYLRGTTAWGSSVVR